MNCIVITTINEPTAATIKYCRKTDWYVIIVGDLLTPHQMYKALESAYKNVHYLTPEYQESNYKELSDIIGWNTIIRRNIGFIEAYKLGAKVIATVDDDNIPYEDWGKTLLVDKDVELDYYVSDNGVFDPLSIMNDNTIWHRGYPIEYLQDRFNIEYRGKINRKVLVQADLWDGDPDIDAITRLIYKPTVKFNITEPYCSNAISPFNSQNTFLSRSAFPCYAILPFIGRMQDIWGSYLLQESFPCSVAYNKASVFQDRNKQDLITNLNDEMIGYRNTLKFIKGEYELPQKTQDFYNVYKKCFE